MKKEFTVEIKVTVTNMDVHLDASIEGEYFVERSTEAAPISEGVVKYIKAFESNGRVFYGYTHSGYNFMMKKEFYYEELLQKEELQMKLRKFGIEIK